jgi:hypothetical protein
LLTQAQEIANSDQGFDRASLLDWQKSYELLRTQAEKNKSSLFENQDFSHQWQTLLAQAMKGNQIRGKASSNSKVLKKYAHTLAILIGVAAVAMPANMIDANQVMLALDYLYANAVPPILKVSEYRFPLLASVVSLLSIIPLVQSVAWLSPYAMKTMAEGIRSASSNLSNKLKAVTAKWQSLNLWQRILTAGARVYGVISVAAWNHLGSILRQPQLFRTLKLGLNPFANISKGSSLGKILQLEKDILLGVNNPFLKQDKLDQRKLQQQQAMQFLTQESLLARHLAFQLVALVLYQSLVFHKRCLL